MAFTATNLAERALERLGVKAAGQSSPAHDQNFAEETATSVFKQIEDDGFAPDFLVSDIPAKMQEGLIMCVAAALMPYYGYSEQESLALRKTGESNLARQAASDDKSYIPAVDYF